MKRKKTAAERTDTVSRSSSTISPTADEVPVEERHREQARLDRLRRAPLNSERDRVLWLLEFVRRDIAALRFGELFDLREDALHRFRVEASITPVEGNVMIFGATPGDRLEDWYPVAAEDRSLDISETTARTLTKLQERVRAGMDALETTGVWRPFSERNLEPPEWFLERREDGTLGRRYPGRITSVFLAAVSDLLEKWWPELRRCERKECRAWFLPQHGRQVYHDSNCSYQVRWAKFAKKRKRDYHGEYEKRVKREVGRGAIPGRHPNRRKKR
ncbi:MAG: hypothetical protein ACRD3V_22200 [Vicinamibacteria bacterium]